MKPVEPDKSITLVHVHKDMTTSRYEIKPASGKRNWIDREIPHMYRCLPVLIANQSGWTVHLPFNVDAMWFGGSHAKTIHFWTDASKHPEFVGPPAQVVDTIFGDGIVTFFFDFFVKTPHRVNLLVRGAPNFYVDGAHPLEGLVETDWLNFTFTMNWKITRPGHLVRFHKDDPICFIQPIPHRYSEEFTIESKNIHDDPEVLASFQANFASRSEFRKNLHETYARGERPKEVWERHYFDGVDARGVSGCTEDNHTVKTRLSSLGSCPFGHGKGAAPKSE